MGVQTIRPASVPLTPISPNVPFNLALGAALGLLVGVAGAFVRNARDTTARSGERLRELTGAPVLSEIPLDRDARLHPLTLGAPPDSAHVEAFRRLRTNLQFLDRPHRVMVVTSAVSGEGSTTTACNLALALADAGYRVLLIDLNLRRPSVRRYMELPPGPGVADVLAGRASMQQALRRWIVGGLDVLPAGPVPPNSSELLASPAADAMLDDVGKHYSFVILDVPALLPVADAAAVAARADGAVLVVRYGKTSEEQVAGAVSALGVVQAPVLGIALTGTPAPRRRRRSRPYPRYEQGPQQASQAQRAQAQPQVPADDTPTRYLQAQEPQAASTAQEAQPQLGASVEPAEQPSPEESSDAAAAATSTAKAPQNGAVERPSPTRRS
jgi:receptor protein-tyrosine kinase